MKLYGGKKRIAKKLARRSWKKIQMLPKDFAVGSVVATCSGFNGVVKSFEPLYYSRSKTWVLSDIDLDTEDGGSCSWRHCCTQAETPEEIEAYFKDWALEENLEQIAEWGMYSPIWFVTILRNGGKICDDRGLQLASSRMPMDVKSMYYLKQASAEDLAAQVVARQELLAFIGPNWGPINVKLEAEIVQLSEANPKEQ